MKKFFIYFSIVLACFAIITFKDRGILDYISVNKKLERLKKENERLEKENKKLKITIKKLKYDLKYIEKIAREKYNMIGDNETVIKIIKKKEVKNGL